MKKLLQYFTVFKREVHSFIDYLSKVSRVAVHGTEAPEKDKDKSEYCIIYAKPFKNADLM